VQCHAIEDPVEERAEDDMSDDVPEWVTNSNGEPLTPSDLHFATQDAEPDMLMIARNLVARGFSIFPLDHPVRNTCGDGLTHGQCSAFALKKSYG
jgi:hypothetical protein